MRRPLGTDIELSDLDAQMEKSASAEGRLGFGGGHQPGRAAPAFA
jgi:hypothetical protein